MADLTPGRALALVPFADRSAAETAAGAIRDAYPSYELLVTEGELGSYLNPTTGEAGYRLVLKGPWSVDSSPDGEIVLTCKSDARPASAKESHDE